MTKVRSQKRTLEIEKKRVGIKMKQKQRSREVRNEKKGMVGKQKKERKQKMYILE